MALSDPTQRGSRNSHQPTKGPRSSRREAQSLKLETRCPEPETQGLELDTQGSERETRSPEVVVPRPKLKARGLKRGARYSKLGRSRPCCQAAELRGQSRARPVDVQERLSRVLREIAARLRGSSRSLPHDPGRARGWSDRARVVLRSVDQSLDLERRD